MRSAEMQRLWRIKQAPHRHTESFLQLTQYRLPIRCFAATCEHPLNVMDVGLIYIHANMIPTHHPTWILDAPER